ncbi:hypothetical protein ACFCT7_08510 [Fulvivirgaceae bacterium LMO-SS25]
MRIFETYSGNAMLNNALMTIEALSNLQSVREITIEILLENYENHDIIHLNKRFKSYTMLFTKNGPLHNDKANGEKIYDSLIRTILNSYEDRGEFVCEISGLRFSTTFEKIYEKALRNIGFSDKVIQKKDISINRGWFPLIGGLGSDAQALPQAKFAIKIHPICVVIMQFLPLSALLYNGGILLIDSSNFEFARNFVAFNVSEVRKRIQLTSSKDSIENIKDYSKGNYLLKAIEILEEKEEFEEEYSDLNLWSFSNSGTGASCSIERVPNNLIKKLVSLKGNTKITNELKSILRRNSHRFLEDLEFNQEWYLLYPNVFGTGKNKGNYEGVSVEFLESYYKIISSTHKTEYAKYLAYLIEKYKSESLTKYLAKRDAWREKEFANDLYAVLVKATQFGEWDLLHHIQILDNAEQVPIKNHFYSILKLTHFYYYKNVFNQQVPNCNQAITTAQKVCQWLGSIIRNDEKFNTIKKDLINIQDYQSTNYSSVFYRASHYASLSLESICFALFDENFRSNRVGVNSLFRIFFNQPRQMDFEVGCLELSENWRIKDNNQRWLVEIREFVQDYQLYYFDKYENKETGEKPLTKFFNLSNSVSNNNTKFLIWFYEAIEKTNDFITRETNDSHGKWTERLLYAPNGEYAISFAKFAIKFSLLKQYFEVTLATNQITIKN